MFSDDGQGSAVLAERELPSRRGGRTKRPEGADQGSDWGVGFEHSLKVGGAVPLP